MVIMASINCPQKECNRVFEKPIIVTNLSFTPKETYSGCPYCLTRINHESKKYNLIYNSTEKQANIETGNPNQTTNTPQIIHVYSSTKKSEYQLNSIAFDLQTPQRNPLENIKTLEQEKTHLIIELAELRKAATEKINCLEKDVAALREEAKILKKLTNR
jgi:hypothetical protein